VYNYLRELDPKLNTADYILTNFDVDTVFHKSFLDILNHSVLQNEKQLAKIVFQPLLYYNSSSGWTETSRILSIRWTILSATFDDG
jgi:hypothetical protein